MRSMLPKQMATANRFLTVINKSRGKLNHTGRLDTSLLVIGCLETSPLLIGRLETSPLLNITNLFANFFVCVQWKHLLISYYLVFHY